MATFQILTMCQPFKVLKQTFVEDDPIRVLYFKPMSWLGHITTHRRDEVSSTSLWKDILCLLCRCNYTGPDGDTDLDLRLQEVSDRYAWRQPLYLYHPLGCQEGSRLALTTDRLIK